MIVAKLAFFWFHQEILALNNSFLSVVQDWREKKDIYVYLLGNYLTENQKFIDEDEDKGTEKCRK